jgi:hypothetical protein
MVAHAFMQTMAHGEPKGCRQIDTGLTFRIADGHG